MKKVKKMVGVGAMVAAAVLLPAREGFATTMTAPNVEDFYTMPFTLSRVDYGKREITVAFRQKVTYLNMVIVDWPNYQEGDADRRYEAMRREVVDWGRTVYNGDVSELAAGQEVTLPVQEGFDFYTDELGLIYYSVSLADGGNYEGKVKYGAGCRGMLLNGEWDEEMNIIEFSDRDYECRIEQFDGTVPISPYGGDYMSKYTAAVVGPDGVITPTTYQYRLVRKDAPMTDLPVDLKTLEQVALEKPAEEEAGQVVGDQTVGNEEAAAGGEGVAAGGEVVDGASVDDAALEKKQQLGVVPGAPETGAEQGETVTADEKPWWVLIPVTAVATFLLCWWVLPDVRYKKRG